MEVMWFYLDECTGFLDQLPKDTMDEMSTGMYGEFARFPNFLTFGQNRHKKSIEISLTMRLVHFI